MEVRLYVTGENYGTVAVFMKYPSASYSIVPHKAVLAKIKIFAAFFCVAGIAFIDLSARS